MGKVKDGASISTTAKASKAGAGGSAKPGRFSSFFANLMRVERYKPLQGRMARRLTTIVLAVIVILGLVQLARNLEGYSQLTKLGIPAIVGVVFGWFVYRLLEYPPFVEFLIATEAEMNKVSWTSREELKRATAVVLITVSLMAVFLFGVDFLWQFLLKLVGVLRFVDTSGLGSDG
jgi:preprotein translocase subunit SecE